MKFTSRGWGMYFISPELVELVKDYTFSKGPQNNIYTPDRVITLAIEAFLSTNGYKDHVNEIRMRRDLTLSQNKTVTLDSLKKEYRDAALYLMQHRDISEKEAIQWVLSHPKSIEGISNV